ncbi:hypothetical protein [Streptomyces sp. NPDC095613]|uniref:hypothetical protein n=1 Tax=Streptomyces sp. NPDC095613 TaxID=3155540 RepID=UPI003317F8F7
MSGAQTVEGTARTHCDEHLLAQLLMLKSYQRMGCFPKLDEVPDTVVDFVRRAADLPEGTVPIARTIPWARASQGVARTVSGTGGRTRAPA